MFDLKKRHTTLAPAWPAAGLLIAAFCFSFAAGPAVAGAAGDELPGGKEVFDKYIEVTGGQEAYDKVTNRVLKMIVDISGQDLHLFVTVYAAKPNKGYSEIEAGVLGTMTRGCDGETVWEISAMTGPVIKEGAERDMMLREIHLDKFAYWNRVYSKVECTALENVGDKPCYKVAATPRIFSTGGEIEEVDKSKAPAPHMLYFDKSSGLLVKVESVITTAMGDLAMETILSDYKEVDDILIPHKTTSNIMGQEMVGTMVSVMHNLRLAEDLFDIPEEIRKLVDK